MRKRNITFLVFSIYLFTTSCEEDVMIGGSGQDQLVVYCLLNQRDSMNYVRIEKTYSGYSNAYEAGKIMDSICPDPRDVNVCIIRHSKASRNSDTIFPVLLEDVEKLPGMFNRKGMLIYGFEDILSASDEYELLIEDLAKQKTLRSMTGLLGQYTWLFAKQEFRRKNISMYKPELIPDFKGSLSWSQNWSRVLFRFYYLEELDGESRLKYVNWQPSAGSFKQAPMEEDSMQFADLYLEMLAENIPVNPEVRRIPVGRDYLLNIYDEQVERFGLIGQVPEDYLYSDEMSNIENGFGLFASSYYFNFFAQKINPRTMDSLVNGQITKNLGFVYP